MNIRTAAALAALVLALVQAPLAPSVARAAGAARPELLCARGDALLASGGASAATIWKARWYYQRALQRALGGTGGYEALWRLARAHALLAQSTGDDATKSARGKRGYELALRAIRIAPGRVEGHFWAALCVGVYGEGLGWLAALRHGIRGKFLRHLERARLLDPGYDEGGPDRVYGMYYLNVPWPLRSRRRAIDHFRASLSRAPAHAMTLYYLARTLRDAGRVAEATAPLRRCAAVDPARATKPAEARRFVRRCRLEQRAAAGRR